MANGLNDAGAHVSRGVKLLRRLLTMTLIWAVCFAALAFLQPFRLESLIAAADIYQLTLGFVLAGILLACLKTSRNRYPLLGTSLAILSWTLGQLFWFSYTLLMRTPLPYPSVGDFGFTGAYFLLIGVLSMLAPPKNKAKGNPYAFALLLAPLLLAIYAKSAPAVKLYNFVLGLAAAWTLQKALPLRHTHKDRWLLGGILLLAATDVVFMTSVVLLRNSMTATTAPLYPIALALIAYGILKREATTDD
jgi:uncharacterized membrane protein HdeD (DUF308 family)